MSPDSLALIFVIVLIIVLIMGIIFAIASKKMRGGGGSINSVTIFGAISQFQTLEQKAAIEHVLEEQAGKKMAEEETGEPEEK